MTAKTARVCTPGLREQQKQQQFILQQAPLGSDGILFIFKNY
jgi:hypothetical protein